MKNQAKEALKAFKQDFKDELRSLKLELKSQHEKYDAKMNVGIIYTQRFSKDIEAGNLLFA